MLAPRRDLQKFMKNLTKNQSQNNISGYIVKFMKGEICPKFWIGPELGIDFLQQIFLSFSIVQKPVLKAMEDIRRCNMVPHPWVQSLAEFSH